jgi:hypothetical protein
VRLLPSAIADAASEAATATPTPPTILKAVGHQILAVLEDVLARVSQYQTMRSHISHPLDSTSRESEGTYLVREVGIALGASQVQPGGRIRHRWARCAVP